MTRKIILTEQPHGGYLPMEEGGYLFEIKGVTETVRGRSELLEFVREAVCQLEGPTEIYAQSKMSFMVTETGRDPHQALAVGDRVFQMQGDSRIEGRVSQLESRAGTPMVDDGGNPVLGVWGDDHEVYDSFAGWHRVS